jgi:chaperone BCS1
VKSDHSLVTLFGNVPSRSILLLEDVDVLHMATSREQKSETGPTLSALLNVLDGVTSPHGLITILTSNYADRLDPALVRPGRADLVEHIGYIGVPEAKQLIELVGGDSSSVTSVPNNLTPAELLQVALPVLPDKEKAAVAMLERLQGEDGHELPDRPHFQDKIVQKSLAAIRASGVHGHPARLATANE